MALTKTTTAIALSTATAALLTLSGCGGGGGSTTSTDNTGGEVNPGITDTNTTTLLYDGAGAADIQERYEADDSTYSVLPAPTLAAAADIRVLSGDITADMTLTADKQWDVQGLVKVKNGATLTVEPGTVVFGDAGANYIVITKGSKIIADGTKEAPIIFTSKTALLNPAAADVGQWGGLTILGAAPTNHADPHYEVDETDPDFAFGDATIAAGDANDDSGILRNVYIMNSGYTVATDLEINGLSLAGVGAGTMIDDVTVVNSSDDCIEIWGGTVDVSNLAMINCQDDSFDLDYGYTGHATNIFVQQKEIAHAGFEISSGGDNPMTMARIENFSINKINGSDEGGIYIKDDTTAPTFVNGLVSTLGETDADLHTKKVFDVLQKATIGFKDVTLK
ncbi:MAG: right-handed parallel beta-helix repeat-containing protein [Campylobacterales bacterium]